MGSQLHQALRNLCLNTGWKYAVFWKLKHHSETLLSWEDTYYDNDDYQQSSCPLDSVGNLGRQLLSDDALGLALAEMTYHVYSLGEGVVGHVAFTGKHFWISADNCAIDSSFFFQCFEGWQSQYSAGIKTVAFVAVIPHGVVQLGSLNEIPEDLSIVGKVREAIYELQDSFLASEALTALPSHMESSCMLYVSTKPLIPLSYHGLGHSSDRQIGMCLNKSTTPPKINGISNSLSDSVLCLEKSSNSSDIIHGSITHDCDGNMVCAPENVNDPAYMLWSGYELSEALGPAFKKQNADMKWSCGDIGTDETTEMVAESLLTENSETSHLLEAVVAKSSKIEMVKRNHSFLISDISSNREIRSEPCSSIGSLSHETFSGLNSSGSFAVPYSRGISSSSCSRGSETLEMSRESRNIHKKRAKPGVNGRPRPRDRQLIQDRIKELRELVPNGSKCSIDSLLEHTIKHMMFMQSVVKQAEKLNICIKHKTFGKEPRLEGASCTDQLGSSWAVEMDNQKECPIIVENVNMHGQMLVEMMCSDGSRFLEISEAICRMGLNILKGDTEPYGEKTWIRFIVQDENKRRLHRMDVLWTLIQLLQTQVINI